MYYRDQMEKIMSEAGFSDSEKEEFELKVNDYVLSDKGNQVLYDDELKDFVAKIEQHGLYEKFKKLLKRKIDTSPTDPITAVSYTHLTLPTSDLV